MSRKSSKRGLTLVELILAILLVNVVILTGLSMEMGMRKLFTGTDFTSQLSNEGTSVMTFVTKKLNRAIGAQAITAPDLRPYHVVAGIPDGAAWTILQDTVQNGIPEPGAGDVPCGFRYYSAGANRGQLCYYANGNVFGAATVVLTTHCIGFTMSDPVGLGYSTIQLRLRRDILTAANATNPELFFVSRAQYLSTSFS